MAQIRMAANNVGGTIQGNFGTYIVGTDGTVTIDSRDLTAMLLLGMTYLRNGGLAYTLPAAPRNASTGRIVASATLSSGALSIANQPDVARQLNVVFGNAGSPSISAGLTSITYLASDGTTRTDTFNAAVLTPQAGNVTVSTSRPVVHISTAFVGAVSGGTTPFVRVDDTNNLGLPADPNAQDFVVYAEYDTGTQQTLPGTASTTCIGATSIQTTPNGTVTYSFIFGFVSPNI